VKQHRNLPAPQDREQLYGYTNEKILNAQSIDYLEFGVFKGDSIRSWVNLNKHLQSRFYGFDSFEGLPERWNRFGKGTADTSGLPPNIHDTRVQFVKGWFQDF
jgi:O-methyltransferase